MKTFFLICLSIFMATVHAATLSRVSPQSAAAEDRVSIGTITVTWDGPAGMVYILETCIDLVADSWATQSIQSGNSTYTKTISLNQDIFAFRVEVSDDFDLLIPNK